MSQLLASGVLNTVWSVILAIVILLAMITVHEFGHFVAGRALGFKVNEFAIGFGPKLLKVRGKKRGTLFTLRAIPLGGFCAFAGEDEEGEEDDPAAFNNRAPWRRIIVLIAGAFMNYLTALVIVIICVGCFGLAAYRVNSVEENAAYPAEYSLQAGDIITEVDGVRIYLGTDLISALQGRSAGDEVQIAVICGDGQSATRTVRLRADCDFENFSETSKVWRALGAGTYGGEDGNLYWDLSAEQCRYGFFGTIGRSFGYTSRMAGTIFRVLGELLTGRLSLDSMGGPITTIKVTSEAAAQGMQSFLTIAAYIGVNLAVFNLLPIPALDGSKVVFCLIEWIFRKPVPRKVEAAIHAVGLVLILAFAVLVDVLQFIKC